MKRDIENRADLEVLVQAFYDRALEDPLLELYFSKVIAVDWKNHLPVMVDFWENVLFFTGAYQGNPMETHQKIHAIQAITAEAFDRWILHFETAVNSLFTGEQAETIKQKARNIAIILQSKLKN